MTWNTQADNLTLEIPNVDTEVLRPFLEDSFDHVEYASRVLQDSRNSSASTVGALSDALGNLDDVIAEEVVGKQDRLLSHVRQLHLSETAMRQIQDAVGGLGSKIETIKGEIQVPYQQLRGHAIQLGHLHATAILLRQVNFRLKQASKLRVILEQDRKQDAGELARAAKLVHETEVVAPAAATAGIDIVDRDLELFQGAEKRIREEARKMLHASMAALGQAEVASALQVCFNLGTLKAEVLQVMDARVHEIGAAMRFALDARQLTGMSSGSAGRGRAGQGGSQRLHEALWRALDECMTALHSGAIAVWHLQRVIAKKRDPLKLTLFADVVQEGEDGSLLDRFWARLSAALAAAARQAVARGGAVRDILAHGFPRLCALIEATLERIARDSDVPGVCSGALPAHRTMLSAALAPFQEAFLGASLARTREAINAAYPASGRTPPTTAAVQQCIAALYEELKAASTSADLTALVAVTLGKGLALLCARASQLVASASELRHFGRGAASPAHLRSIMVSSQLFEVQRACLMLLPKLPAAASEVLSEPLQHLQAHATEAVLPIFAAATLEAEGCIAEMHSALAAAGSSSAIMSTSSYVQRVGAVLQRFRTEYLSHFSPAPSAGVPTVASLLCRRMASRLVALFVRHAALLKPLDQPRKLQIAKDMSELEAVLRQWLYPPDLLRDAHGLLKAFRTMMFAEDESLSAAATVPAVPAVTFLLHCFSRLPDSVPHPHVRTQVAAKQFSQWMDQHSSDEVLRAISSAPLAAVDHPVAKIMLQLLA